jgi:hypothetical protein
MEQIRIAHDIVWTVAEPWELEQLTRHPKPEPQIIIPRKEILKSTGGKYLAPEYEQYHTGRFQAEKVWPVFEVVLAVLMAFGAIFSFMGEVVVDTMANDLCI